MTQKRKQKELSRRERNKRKQVQLTPPKVKPGLPPVHQFIPQAHIKEEYRDRKPIIELDKCDFPLRLLLKQKQSPGDIVAMTSAIRDLHHYYPGWFITGVDTPCDHIFEASPYITDLKGDPRAIELTLDYPLIHRSNKGGHHFCHAFVKELNSCLGLNVELTELRGDIHLSEDEKAWYSQIYEIVGKDIPYWIIDAGCKHDYTNKMWEFARYQDVVSALPEITFVQIGSNDKNHMHHDLRGDNVIDLIGKTDLRQLIRLVYHSYGVITPVSLPMHLSAAIDMHPRYKRSTRPCIVIAGGREPSVWEMYTNHAYLHKCGMLDCCYEGGCWKSRVYEGQVGDGDEKDKVNLCEHPITTESGQVIPKCLDMITSEDVIRAVKDYDTPKEVDQPKIEVKEISDEDISVESPLRVVGGNPNINESTVIDVPLEVVDQPVENDEVCSVCDELQVETPSEFVCKSGHGGAPAKENL